MALLLTFCDTHLRCEASSTMIPHANVRIWHETSLQQITSVSNCERSRIVSWAETSGQKFCHAQAADLHYSCCGLIFRLAELCGRSRCKHAKY